MNIKILEKPFSLVSRALSIGVSSHVTLLGAAQPVIAASDPSPLVAFRRKHPGLHAIYVWAVLDGFFLLTEYFNRGFLKADHDFITPFVVGDCGGLADLRLASKREDLQMLFHPDCVYPLISRLQTANWLNRLHYHIPPAWTYETWDFIKDPLAKPISPERVQLFFAGNDGLKGIGAIFSALEAIPELEKPGFESARFAESVIEALNRDCTLPDLALIASNYYTKLSKLLEQLLDSGLTDEGGNRQLHRLNCFKALLFKSLFRYFVLMWVESNHLGVVITRPVRNKSFYSHRKLDHLLMLDFGGLNGFEDVYPRSLDCMLYRKQIISLNSTSKLMFHSLQLGDCSAFYQQAEAIELRLRKTIFRR